MTAGNPSKRKSRWPDRTVADRFWEKVDKSGPIPDHMPHLGPCWLWNGARLTRSTPDGYGVFNTCQKDAAGRDKLILAHVFAYVLANGEVPEGLNILHHCDRKRCVNDTHLWSGTQAENVADMDAKGRRKSKALPGSANPNSKLSEYQVSDIRIRTERGERFVDLAREYSVDRALIRRIHLRKVWRHI